MQPLMTRSVAAFALTLALAACSGGSDGTPKASPSAATPAAVAAVPVLAPALATGDPSPAPTTEPAATPEDTSAADVAAVRKAYVDYNQALLGRDFTTACAALDPTAAEAIVSAINTNGGAVADCPAALAAVYASPQAAGPLDEAARSLTISDVSVSGDGAVVTYGGTVNGTTMNGLITKLEHAHGTWLLLGL